MNRFGGAGARLAMIFVSELRKYGVETGFLGRICKGFAPGAVRMVGSSERE